MGKLRKMSQEEVYHLIKEKPRLCSREIADELGIELKRACTLIGKMVNKDLIAVEPTVEEFERLRQKYPKIKYAAKTEFSNNRIKLWEVIE